MRIVSEPQIRENQKAILHNLAAGRTNILEIGSWVGESTVIFAEAMETDGRITCIDWFKGNPKTHLWVKTREGKYADKIYEIFLDNILAAGCLDRINVFRGDSRIMHKYIKDEFYDLIYIDGDHRYSRASLDIKNYLPKLKAGGVIAGHDFESFEYDERFVEEDYVGKKHHGNIKAVVNAFPAYQINAVMSIWWVVKRP